MTERGRTRRQVIAALGAAALASTLPARGNIALRRIGTDGPRVGAIGMGSWLTFDVLAGSPDEAVRQNVAAAFFEHGGSLIDSSPMYGRSEEIIGRCLSRLQDAPVFAASKVWKFRRNDGIEGFRRSRELWQVPTFDLMQIHNMLSWEAHLDWLLRLRDDGRVRYLGITTSHGRRHQDMEAIIRSRPEFDAVQFTYNATHRKAERRLLPAAIEHGKAVIVNRPFDGGRLPRALAGKPLPGFAPELGCTNWAQLCLKFVISHPGVTCAIPATRRVDHMIENMGALRGAMPDASLRARIATAIENA